MEKQEFLEQLRSIVGQENVISHPEDLLVYEYDGSVDRAMPEAVVLPSSTEQVSRVLALAYREGVPVAGRGSGTGLSGGAIAPPGGIQVVFTRMNQILEIDTENLTATVEPGVINLDLDTQARKLGLRYAPDPSSQKACSLGGNIAENAGGPHCLAYGTTTNHVVSMEVVLEDGAIVQLGGPAREVPGYDLRGVFVGSEGTFGMATRITVRLLPLPEMVKTFLGIFPDIESACSAVSAIIGRGIVPAALEMIDSTTIRAVQSVIDAGYPNDAGAVLLVELEGLTEEVEEISEEVQSSLWETGAADVRVAEESTEREKLWLGRKAAFGAFGAIAPNYYLVDGVVPRTRLAEVLRLVGDVSRRYGITIANVFHAGDGNLHPCMLFDEREPGILAKAMEAAAELMEYCAEVGGTLSGEHGIGLEKKEFMPLVFTDDDMAAMRQVRDAFAPENRLNPGKIFPDGTPPSLVPHRPAAPGMFI
ncbi:MAG: FAD-binding oxidoreductase [Stenotrophomonas maltophilia]